MSRAREYLATVTALAEDLSQLTDEQLEQVEDLIQEASDAVTDALNKVG